MQANKLKTVSRLDPLLSIDRKLLLKLYIFGVLAHLPGETRAGLTHGLSSCLVLDRWKKVDAQKPFPLYGFHAGLNAYCALTWKEQN